MWVWLPAERSWRQRSSPPQARQHQIQHHQAKLLTRRALLQGAQSIATVAAGRDGKPLQDKDVTDSLADRVVVLDNKEGGVHPPIISVCGGQIPEPAQRRGR